MKALLIAILVGVCCSLALAAGFEGGAVDGPGRVVAGAEDYVHVAYESPKFQPVTVRLPQPLPLPPDIHRVRFWYARMAGDFDLFVLLRDASGEERRVATHTSRPTFPGIRRFKMREWSVWNQAESVALGLPARLEERVQPEYMELAQKSVWLRPLALVGIQIVPAKDRRDNEAFPEQDTIRAGRGELFLADMSLREKDGLQAQFNWFLEGRWRWGLDAPPRLFLDDLTLASGAVRYALELQRDYQGPTVWRKEGQASLDRAKPMQTFADRIELPELPQGHYFLTSKTWKPDGSLGDVREMRLCVATGKPRDLAPVESPLQWETGQPNHVFPCEATEATLTLKVKPEAWPADAACQVRVVDWLSRPVCSATLEKAAALRIPCAGLKEGTDYHAIAEWRVGDKLLNRTALHFGVASKPPAQGRKPPAGLPTRDELFMSRRATPIAEHWGSLLSSRFDREPLTEDKTKDFERWLAETDKLGFKLISFNFGWGEAEPLPGVFRWAEIERRLELARQRGMRAFLVPTEWGHPLEFPRWLEYAPVLDQRGSMGVGAKNPELQPSILDPSRQQERERWLRAVAERFLANPTVVGYRTKPFVYPAENQPEFTRTDYAPPMQAGFGKWLRSQGREPFRLPKLFVLYPYSPARTGPDFSDEWQQFMAFRTHNYVEAVRQIMASVRSVDPVRQIHIYRSSMPNACEAAIPLLKDGGEFHDEGGPFYFQRAVESLCLQAGIPYTNEGHQFTPPSKAMADAGFFYGSCYDRGWCWLYRWDVHRPEDKRFAALPQVLRFISESMPAVQEWVAAQGDAPQVLVFGSRADRLLGGSRQGFYSDIAGLDVFTALFCYHQLPAHFATEHTDWVDLSAFKLVLAAGDAMARHGIDRLVDHAGKGGKVALVGDAGRFCAEQPAARDLLRKALEGKPNVTAIAAASKEPPAPGAAFRSDKAFDDADLDRVLTWAGVSRTVTAASPAFECVRKQSSDGHRFYVAVYRRWPGVYDNIWYDAEVERRWGREATEVIISGLRGGRWCVEQFHRATKAVGEFEAKEGVVRFKTDAATVGELQLFRLTRR